MKWKVLKGKKKWMVDDDRLMVFWTNIVYYLDSNDRTHGHFREGPNPERDNIGTRFHGKRLGIQYQKSK